MILKNLIIFTAMYLHNNEQKKLECIFSLWFLLINRKHWVFVIQVWNCFKKIAKKVFFLSNKIIKAFQKGENSLQSLRVNWLRRKTNTYQEVSSNAACQPHKSSLIGSNQDDVNLRKRGLCIPQYSPSQSSWRIY